MIQICFTQEVEELKHFLLLAMENISNVKFV